MSLTRFEQLRRFLHFVDNADQKAKGEDGFYPLFKVRKLLDIFRAQCLLVPPEEKQCVDEQMIPFKGRSNIKQYLPKKPTKWGFKAITRTSSSGIINLH